ncbi:MAG: 3-hydroxybutyryl-CoA dehydrogenase [Rhodothermia bacterium]
MPIELIAVVGGGTMGNGIAHVCALAELNVHLVDIDQDRLDRALREIERNLARQVAKGRLTDDTATTSLARISTFTDLVEAVVEADLIVEAATEQRDTKAAIFGQIDDAAKGSAILASNTSSISITWLAAQTKRPESVVRMHFFNPVPVMKLVEIVRGIATSDQAYDTVVELASRLGKDPVAVNDAPGFVSNRVLMPMINEAVFCLMEGVATAEAIDSVMRLGMAHPMGPLTLADFIGLDVCLAIMNVMHSEIGDDKYRPCPLLKKMVDAGYLGRKSGRGFYEYS